MDCFLCCTVQIFTAQRETVRCIMKSNRGAKCTDGKKTLNIVYHLCGASTECKPHADTIHIVADAVSLHGLSVYRKHNIFHVLLKKRKLLHLRALEGIFSSK